MAVTTNCYNIIATNKDHLVHRSQSWDFNSFCHFLCLCFSLAVNRTNIQDFHHASMDEGKGGQVLKTMMTT